MKNVLITGATGFVGSRLLPEVLKRGYSVTCLVRTKEKAEEIAKKYNVNIHIGDVTQPESLKGIAKVDTGGINYVIHLAAMGHVSAVTEEAFQKFVAVNEAGAKNLANEFLGSADLKKFIHFSSTAAMGHIGKPILNEESVPNPLTPYQKSKYRSEQIIKELYETQGFPGIVLRPCMIYGVGGYGEFYKFCRLMKKGLFPKVGLGKNLTPLVHVDDVVQATLLALENGAAGQTYIIASEQSIPMDDLRNIIVNSIGVRPPYIFVPSFIALPAAYLLEKAFSLAGKEPIVTYRNIKSTITDRTFDIRKAKEELGYLPLRSFEDGIRETVEWYKAQGAI